MTISETQTDATTTRPSVASIVLRYVLAAITLGGAIFSTTADTFDGRHLVGLLTGLIGSAAFVIQAGNRVTRRLDARRAERRNQEYRRRDARRAEVARNLMDGYVGRWRNPETGEVQLTVRYLPKTGQYLALGWIAAGWEAVNEFPFVSAAVAFVALVEAERDGLVPDEDEGTRLIRARLRMPGWDEADTSPSSYVPA